MQCDALSDAAAFEECRRILKIVSAQRRLHAQWFGEDAVPGEIACNEDSAFAQGMLAMFRYARGMAIPAVIVQDFRDELLRMMFCGLASGTLALPPFRRMADKPWAMAWRLAEIRLALEGHETTDLSQLAHLLAMPQNALACELAARGYDPMQPIPAEFLQKVYTENLNAGKQATETPKALNSLDPEAPDVV